MEQVEIIGYDPGIEDLCPDETDLNDAESLRSPRAPRPPAEQLVNRRWRRGPYLYKMG